MKYFSILLSSLLLLSCSGSKQKPAQSEGHPFYVGTYTGGESRGIYRYLLHDDGTMDSIGLLAETPNPSYLAKSADNKFLFSISEVGAQVKLGRVKSYRITGDSLEFISESASGGAHMCFIGVNEDRYIVVTSYTDGYTALLRHDTAGVLSEVLDLEQHEGSDVTDRQRGPHAHSAWFDPNDNSVISVDLGTNELWFYDLDTLQNKLMPQDPPTLRMAPGAGPRHLAYHPNGKWIYVVNELDCTVTLVEKLGKARYSIRQSITTLPLDYVGKNSCAHILVSSDGRYVYASNRGHNSIAIFSVNERDGLLKALGHHPTHGDIPRNFTLSPGEKFLVVANQSSRNIVALERDAETGLLSYASEVAADKAVCVVF